MRVIMITHARAILFIAPEILSSVLAITPRSRVRRSSSSGHVIGVRVACKVPGC